MDAAEEAAKGNGFRLVKLLASADYKEFKELIKGGKK